jgi:hypothetical protein
MIKSSADSTSFEQFCQATEHDLGRVEGPVLDQNLNKEFYIVRSAEDDLVEYQVHNLSTCTCGTPDCEHVALARAADTEHRIAMALLGLKQAEAVLRQRGIKDKDVELAQYTIECAKRELASLGVKLPTIEEKWNIPAWMMRNPGPRVAIEDDDLLD